MRHWCDSPDGCGRSYDDEFHSTICPHRGIGFCAVCDCVVCVCTQATASDWERSNNNRESEGLAADEPILRIPIEGTVS